MAQQPQTAEEIVQQMRNNIIISATNAQQSSLSAFDQIIQLLQTTSVMLKNKDNEIHRLEQLCKENNIDTTPKQQKPVPSQK